MSLTLLLNKEKKCHEDPTLKNIIRIFNKHVNFGKFNFHLKVHVYFSDNLIVLLKSLKYTYNIYFY